MSKYYPFTMSHVVKIPLDTPDEHFNYDYKLIHKLQRNSEYFRFSKILYDALIAEIIFLYFHHLDEKPTSFLFSLYKASTIIDLEIFKYIYFFPIVLLCIFLVSRTKRYLLDELPLDIDTIWDKAFFILIPILLSFVIYLVFDSNLNQYWLYFASTFFIVDFIITLFSFHTFRANEYRGELRTKHKSKNQIKYKLFNKHGIVRQTVLWSQYLGVQSMLMIFLAAIYQFALLKNIISPGEKVSMLAYGIIVGCNYLICLLIVIIIYRMTKNSKSCRPISIEAYENEMQEYFNSMSFRKSQPYKSTKTLEIQYRAVEYLKTSEFTDKQILEWKKNIDEYLDSRDTQS